MAETERILHELCALTAPIFPQEQVDAILFGSHARGDAQPDSDIDVLLLVDSPREVIAQRNWQIGDVAAELLMEHGVVVSPIVENRSFFENNASLFPLFRNIQREGVRYRA